MHVTIVTTHHTRCVTCYMYSTQINVKWQIQGNQPKETIQYCTYLQSNNGPWSWYYRHHMYMSTIPICPSPYLPLFHLPSFPPHSIVLTIPGSPPPLQPHLHSLLTLPPSPYVLPLLPLSPPISPSMSPPPPQVIVKSTHLSTASHQDTSHQGSVGWAGTTYRIMMIDMYPS